MLAGVFDLRGRLARVIEAVPHPSPVALLIAGRVVIGPDQPEEPGQQQEKHEGLPLPAFIFHATADGTPCR